MAQATFYIDTASFSTATAVFSDRALQTKAADGYYSDEIIVRRQVSGVLQPAVNCPNCGSPPPTPTEYCVSQFPVNQITLDTGAAAVEGVDFTLTGDTTNPTIKCGIPGAVVSFNILASPAVGKQFRASDPFNGSINGDDIVVPSSNINVNNILTGVIEDIPVTTAATQYIFLGACINDNVLFEQNYSGQSGLFLEVTKDELTILNAASGNQRYAATDSRGNVNLLYYDKTDSRNNPVKTTLTQTEKQNLIGTFNNTYWGTLTAIKVAGEFDCPVYNTARFGVFRRCVPVAGQSITFSMQLTQAILDSSVFTKVNTRYADSSGNPYVLESVRPDSGIDPAITDLLPVDIYGTRFGERLFTFPATGCPEDVYIIQSCTDVYGTGLNQYRLPGGVSDWPESDIGTLFEVSGGVCYEIIKRVSEAESKNYNTYYLTKAEKRGEGGCGDCPGIQ